MENLKDMAPKCKRMRTKPTKKWSATEEKMLVEFLMSNRDLEKPTAQLYYRRFSIEMKVECEWKLTRAKVRNMRIKYNKAKSWEGSTGAGSMEGETIKATLLKMCSFFYELDEIFGTRLVESAIIEESLEESLDFAFSTDMIEETIEIDVNETLPSNNLQKEIENVASTSRKGIYSRTAAADIIAVQTEMLKFRREKAEKELSLKEKEIGLKERELELREKEIQSNETLKMMELEMKERLAMEELQLKYK